MAPPLGEGGLSLLSLRSCQFGLQAGQHVQNLSHGGRASAMNPPARRSVTSATLHSLHHTRSRQDSQEV